MPQSITSSEPDESRRFLPGDEIRIEVELEHRANIEDVELILVNGQNGGAELSLRSDLTVPDRIEERPDGTMVSSFALSRVVPPEAPSGLYDATVLRCRTASGLWTWKVGRRRLGALGGLSLEVVDEDLHMRVLDYDYIDEDD